MGTIAGGIIIYAVSVSFASFRYLVLITHPSSEDTRTSPNPKQSISLTHLSPQKTHSGLQILTQILIADTTTLQYRGLVSSLVSLPFLINGFIGPNLAAWVLKVFDGDKDDGGGGQRKGGNGWRVGCASFFVTFVNPAF